jgi:hypothetical protein
MHTTTHSKRRRPHRLALMFCALLVAAVAPASALAAGEPFVQPTVDRVVQVAGAPLAVTGVHGEAKNESPFTLRIGGNSVVGSPLTGQGEQKNGLPFTAPATSQPVPSTGGWGISRSDAALLGLLAISIVGAGVLMFNRRKTPRTA